MHCVASCQADRLVATVTLFQKTQPLVRGCRYFPATWAHRLRAKQGELPPCFLGRRDAFPSGFLEEKVLQKRENMSRLCHGIRSTTFDSLAATGGGQGYAAVNLEGQILWRDNRCHECPQPALDNGLCYGCVRAYNCLVRRLERSHRPTASDRAKFVPLSKRRPTYSLGQSSTTPAADLTTVIQSPASLKVMLLQAMPGIGCRSSSHPLQPEEISMFVGHIADLLCFLAKRAAGGLPQLPESVMDLLVLHSGKYGYGVIDALQSVIPLCSRRTLRREMQRRVSAGPQAVPGFNYDFIDLLHEPDMLVIPMDGTRVVRTVSVVPSSGDIVGPEWPADVDLWPVEVPNFRTSTAQELEDYTVQARAEERMASELYCCYCQQRKTVTPLLLLPQQKKQFTGMHLGRIALKIVQSVLSRKPGQWFCGFSTDADSKQQVCFRRLLTLPISFLDLCNLRLLYLPHWSMCFSTPVIGPRALMSHYPDCNHLLRSLVRNLLSPLNIPRLWPPEKTARDIDRGGMLHFGLLRWLRKQRHLKHILSGDLDPTVLMNADAAERIFSPETVSVLQNLPAAYQPLRYVVEACLMVTLPFRKNRGVAKTASMKARPAACRAIDVVRETIRGLTRIRIWRLMITMNEANGMRLGPSRKEARGCSNFLTTSTYFALEVLAQAAVQYVFWMALVLRRMPSELEVDLTECTTDRTEYSFGRHRGNVRVSGAAFTIAEFLREVTASMVYQEVEKETVASGSRLPFHQKKKKLFGSMIADTLDSSSLLARAATGAEASFEDIQKTLVEVVDSAAQSGIRDAFSFPQIAACFSTVEKLAADLQATYRKAFETSVTFQEYTASHVVSAFWHLDAVDAVALTDAMWRHKEIAFPFPRGRRTDTVNVAGAGELLSIGNREAFPEQEEAEEEDVVQNSGQQKGISESDAGQLAEEAAIARSVLRSFFVDSTGSPLLQKTRLSFCECRQLLKQANTFRETLSRDRGKRFMAPLLPGNHASSPCSLNLYDICIIRSALYEGEFFAAVATIHEERSERCSVDLSTKQSVWLNCLQLVLLTDNVLCFEDDQANCISLFEPRRHIVEILRATEHYVEDSDGRLRLTANAFQTVLCGRLAATRSAPIDHWGEPKPEADAAADQAGPDMPNDLLQAEQQGVHLDIDLPAEPEILGTKLVQGNIMYKVRLPDSSRAVFSREEVLHLGQNVLERFEARGRKRERRPNQLDEFSYDPDEMDCAADVCRRGRHR